MVFKDWLSNLMVDLGMNKLNINTMFFMIPRERYQIVSRNVQRIVRVIIKLILFVICIYFFL